MKRNRWSDNDRNFGPFTYSRDRKGYRPLALILRSGNDEYPGASLRFSAFGHTLISSVPRWVVKPHVERVTARYWDAEMIEHVGRDWYEEIEPREYGFTCSDGYLSVAFGRVTHDSSTEQRWGCFLPWTQWRHVRRSLYGLDGEHFWTEPARPKDRLPDWDANKAAEDACPVVAVEFLDFDGEPLTARLRIEEREWRFGTGKFKWLSVFRRPKIQRSLSIEFSGETGSRKGSWKGGTIGTSITMVPGELHDAAFRRYCGENRMTFVGQTP